MQIISCSVSSILKNYHRKLLIILDGHHRHKSLEAVDFCRRHGIELLTLPPHSSHKIQHLDKTYFRSLKAAYNAEIDSWLVQHPGKVVTLYEIAPCQRRHSWRHQRWINRASRSAAYGHTIPRYSMMTTLKQPQRTPLQAPAAPVILGTVAPQQKTPRSSMRTILKQPNRISLQAPAAPIVKVPHRNQ